MRWFIVALMLLCCFESLRTSAIADDLPITPPEPIKSMELVLVKGGCYQMGDTFADGSENEQPTHTVCVKDFYIGKFLVTQLQWAATMGNNPSVDSRCGFDCPVGNVSWNDVQGFLRKLGQREQKVYRLPTEAEWEYAARSGGKNERWAGTSDLSELPAFGWYYNNSDYRSHPVGQKKPNGLGLYDMTGNVWEWMSDWYDENYYSNSPKDEPQGPLTGQARSLRGGYWGDLARFVRTSRRVGASPSALAGGNGFRVVVSAP